MLLPASSLPILARFAPVVVSRDFANGFILRVPCGAVTSPAAAIGGGGCPCRSESAAA